MGQQQVLFLIIGACAVGIAICAGVIAAQSSDAFNERELLSADLHQLAVEAQAYRLRPFEQSGGDGTFLGLTSTAHGILKLTKYPSKPHGDFTIATSGNTRFVRIMATGHSPGSDGRRPIKIIMTVFAEAVSIDVLN